MIQLKITSDTLDEVDNQLALIFAYEDIRPLRGHAGLLDWRLNGKISEIILEQHFSGQLGEALLMPSDHRVGTKEVFLLGMGKFSERKDQNNSKLINMILEKLLQKKSPSFCLSLSDLTQEMFEWRNAVRLFISLLSGRKENYQISLLEPPQYVEDARKRGMDFAFDVQVQYS